MDQPLKSTLNSIMKKINSTLKSKKDKGRVVNDENAAVVAAASSRNSNISNIAINKKNDNNNNNNNNSNNNNNNNDTFNINNQPRDDLAGGTGLVSIVRRPNNTTLSSSIRRKKREDDENINNNNYGADDKFDDDVVVVSSNRLASCESVIAGTAENFTVNRVQETLEHLQQLRHGRRIAEVFRNEIIVVQEMIGSNEDIILDVLGPPELTQQVNTELMNLVEALSQLRESMNTVNESNFITQRKTKNRAVNVFDNFRSAARRFEKALKAKKQSLSELEALDREANMAYEQGMELLRKEDSIGALKYLKSAAELGHPHGQLMVGKILLHGRGVPRDVGTAKVYLKRAAEKPEMGEAIYELGQMKEIVGKGVESAAKKYKEAAAAGWGPAYTKLGMLIDEQQLPGTALDAALFFESGMKLGDAVAPNLLALLCCREARLGSEKNDVQLEEHGFTIDRGLEILHKAAAHGNNVISMNNLGILYEEGIVVERNVEKALDLYRRAAGLGHSPAALNAGYLMLLEGNSESALPMLQLAMDRGCHAAAFYLGSIYEHGGAGTEPIDLPKAFSLYAHAARTCLCHKSMNRMACLLYSGLCGSGPMESRYVTAIKLFEESVAQGNPDAMNNLGVILEEGKITKRDVNRAIRLFSKASKAGNADAAFNLGQLYEGGRGVIPSITTAVECYELALQNGHIGSAAYLKRIRTEISSVYKKTLHQNVVTALTKLDDEEDEDRNN